MDWIEKQTAAVRQYIRNVDLSRSMFCYMLLAACGVTAIWVFTRNLCESWMGVSIGTPIHVNGGQVDEGILLQVFMSMDTPVSFRIAYGIYRYSLYFYMAAASFLVSYAFLKQKIEPAIQAVRECEGYIAAGDYSHEVAYFSTDEMGEICRDFEHMRKRLAEEKRRGWQNEEEQRKLNAAFAHDVRTPLTVIRGYTEFLQRYLPQGKVSEEMLMEKLSAMHYQEERLLAFSKTMTLLLREEAREVCGTWIDSRQLARNIEGSGREVAKEHEMPCEIRQIGVDGTVFVDCGMIEEVFDNLLANAVRYAKTRVLVEIVLEYDQLYLFVADDGAGFSAKALRSASDAYFSEEKEDGEHFGIGLSIVKMLCEKHGGYLRLVNSVEGGAIACAAFSVGKK